MINNIETFTKIFDLKKVKEYVELREETFLEKQKNFLEGMPQRNNLLRKSLSDIATILKDLADKSKVQTTMGKTPKNPPISPS